MLLIGVLVFGFLLSETDQKFQCGKRLTNRKFKSMNSYQAKHNDFPWAVAIVFVNHRGLPSNIRCSGTLITKRHVVTAAHCVYKPRSTVPYPKFSVVVSDNIQNPLITIKEEKRYIHSSYQPTSNPLNYHKYQLINDIMIIKLAKDVPSKYGVPICVRRWNKITERFFYTVYGFGKTADNYWNKKLYYFKSAIQENRGYLAAFVFGKKIPKHTCPGDSGGGVSFQATDGREILAGVVAGSTSHANCNKHGKNGRHLKPGDYSALVDIRKHYDFICRIAKVGC